MADLTQDLINYQNAYNNTIWNREDTAVQRRVNDLKAAGLSPILAANGQGASAGGQSNSPSNAVNVALDYMASMASASAQSMSAQASMAQASASMMNANIREAELAEQRRYNDLYFSMMTEYYSALTGKTNAEKDTAEWNLGKFKNVYNLPTTANGVFTSSLFAPEALALWNIELIDKAMTEGPKSADDVSSTVIDSLLSPPEGVTRKEFEEKQKSGSNENANFLTKLFSKRKKWD